MTADQVAQSVHSRSELEQIRAFLDREDVRKEMRAHEINAYATKARVAALTDEELHEIADNMDKMPPAVMVVT